MEDSRDDLVRGKPRIIPESATDGDSEYASAMGTPTKESFETPLNSESSTETLQEVRPTPRDGGSEQAKRTVSVSRQPVAQPYVPPDLPKLLLHEPVEPSEVKVPLDEDDYIQPAPVGQTRIRDGAERTPLLSPQTSQGVRPSSNNDDSSCCTVL
ncbi:hypothetical protein EMCRGX_G000731 [Ephydatia muelleri]|eukprot:Em0001g570a